MSLLGSLIYHEPSNTDTMAPVFIVGDMDRSHKVSTEETVKALKRKYKLQAMYWQDAYDNVVQKMQLFQKEKNEELTFLSTQLLILEAKLRKKNRTLTDLITEKDEMLAKQEQIIDTLTDNLKKANSVAIHAVIRSHQIVSSISTDSGIVDEVNSHTMSFISEDVNSKELTKPNIETVASSRENSMKKSWNLLKNFKSSYVRSVSNDTDTDNFASHNEAENINNLPKYAIGEIPKLRKAHITRRKTISTSDLDFISKSDIHLNNKNKHSDQHITDAKSIESNDYIIFDRAMSTNRSLKKTGEEKFQRINRSTSKNLEKICHMFAKS